MYALSLSQHAKSIKYKVGETLKTQPLKASSSLITRQSQ